MAGSPKQAYDSNNSFEETSVTKNNTLHLNSSGPIHSAFTVQNVAHLQEQPDNGSSNNIVK